MKKGFTLIELLIVISIIGILAVALLPNVLNAPVRGRDAARKADVATIVKAVETYNVDKGAYPATFCTGTAATSSVAQPTAALLNYFSGQKAPVDPAGATYKGTDAAGTGCVGGYQFCRKDGTPYNYVIISRMETSANNNSTAAPLTDCTGTAAYTATAGTANYAVAQ